MDNTHTTPLVSIVTVTLNDHDGLVRTIESLQTQIGEIDYEHIIVDGMSNYDVAGLISELSSTARLHQGKDDGLYDAMNRGTQIARGNYILYLNSGDTLAEPELLAVMGAKLIALRPDFLWGDSLERQLNGEICYKTSRPIRWMAFGMISHHQSMIFSLELINKNAISFDLSLKIAADYDFLLRYVKLCFRIVYLPQPVCIFERGGASYQKREEARREQFRVRRAFYFSTMFATIVFVGQSLLCWFRRMFPGAYWKLR